MISWWTITAAFLAVFLGACGGGGGGGAAGDPTPTGTGNGDSSMTLNVASQATATTTTAFTGSLTTTPTFWGGMISMGSYTQTTVQMSGPNLQVSVCAKVNSGPGTYTIDPGLMCTGVQYIEMSSGTGTVIYGATSGTVTITSFGGSGTPIAGSFDSVVTNATNSTDSKKVWGSFSVKRIL